MASDDEKNNDFYAVLGLEKECTPVELRNAYKKLALKWHPDRCSATGNTEEAKNKFQAIQQAYSVLSDANKRLLYDVGVYDCDDDNDENGMGDFLKEMATMMSQNKSNKNGETFEELQELFDDMFQSDLRAFGSTSNSATPSACSSSSYTSCSESYSTTNKRNSSQLSSNNFMAEATQFEAFCIGVDHKENTRWEKSTEGSMAGGAGSSRRDGRKQKVSSGHDVSSNKYSGISA